LRGQLCKRTNKDGKASIALPTLSNMDMEEWEGKSIKIVEIKSRREVGVAAETEAKK
jgi:hypothetical protein